MTSSAKLNYSTYLKALAIQLLLLVLIEGGFRLYSSHIFRAPIELQNIEYQKTDKLMVQNVVPYAGFTLYPDLKVKLLGKTLTTNERGHRTPNFKKSKGEQVYRIIGIGDSVMMGHGVADSEVYLRRLEEDLSKCRTTPVEVINLAISGQSAEQEYYLLKAYLDLTPDMVIFGYVGNDWINEEVKETRSYFSSPSYALNFIVLQLMNAFGALTDSEDRELKTIEWRPFRPEERIRNMNLTKAYLEMSMLLQKESTPSFVVMDSRYESQFASHQELEGFFKKIGMNPINLLSMWHPFEKPLSGQEATNRNDEHNLKYLIPKDLHPNALWHKDVSKVLFDTLSRTVCNKN
jgi:hypothetical protein